MIYSTLFWRAAVERAVKTFAQTLLAVFTAGHVGLLDVPWTAALSSAGLAALLSLLTSVSTVNVGDRGMPGMVRATGEQPTRPETVPEPAPAVSRSSAPKG
jgi:hypothetical protein